LAKKKKRSERASFLFDEDAGRDRNTIDLFGPDDEPSSDEPDPAYAAPEEPEADEPSAPKEADEPSGSKKTAETPKFRFDRYGRRIGKHGARYGKRKNVPKATTTVVEHETEAKREYEEARARSEARAKKRAREEEKAAAIRKSERKKRRRRSFTTLLLGVAALAGFVLLTLFVTRLSKVHVVNVPSGYTEERIIELSGLSGKLEKKKLTSSALFISTKKVEEAIKNADPYLDATVRYVFPSTINITVSKRTEAACVLWGPSREYLAIIDENGTVLNDRAETANGLLIAEGMNVSSANSGTRLGDASDIQVSALIRILTKLKDYDLLEREPRINRIDMTELMQIRMYIEGRPYTIELGDTTNLDTKLMRLQKGWSRIMDDAADFVRAGYTTVTVYLYTRDGVNVSPYESGTVMSTPEPPSQPTPSPGEGETVPSTPDPNFEPTDDPGDEPQDQPEVTPMPHQDDPFTG
jgi:hypothetical protein